MVGIPGRSKACLTCLRRRKACDLHHPACKQCQRLGLECTWYKHQTIFVDATAKTVLSAEKRYCSTSSSSSSLSCTQGWHSLQKIPFTRLTASLQRSVSQHDYISLFLDSYLPGGCQSSSEIPKCSTASWIVTACAAGHNRDGKHGMLQLAIIACSLCMRGFQQGDDRVLGEGRLVYGRALLQLMEGLKNMGKTNRLALVRSARMLSLFEIFFGWNGQCDVAHGQAWIAHNHGERCLLLGSNADIYRSGEAHEAFVDGRFHLTAENIFRRKASVLGEWQWKTVPWLERPKTPKDLLLDLFIEISRLFETFDKLRKRGRDDDGTRDLMQQLIKDCCHLSNELGSWYLTTGSEIESRVMMAMEEEDEAASMEYLASAQLINLYWCCLLLFIELWQAAPELQEAWTLVEIPGMEGAQTICGNILKVIAMFLSPHSGWLGANLAACPLLLIHNYIQRQEQMRFMEKEARILQNLLETVKGRILAAFIRSATWSRIAMFPTRHSFNYEE